MKKLIIFTGLLLTQICLAQVSVTPLADLPAKFCALKKLEIGKKGLIKRFAITYLTKNKYGTDILASGLIAYRHDIADISTPIFYMHATPRIRADVPTQGSFESKFFVCNALSDKTVVIAPDYIGLGAAASDHPYMVKKMTVSASMDFFRVAKSWLDKQNIITKDEIVMAGYSQGGHAVLATHQHIEEFEKDIKIKRSFSMSGPTNLSVNMLANILFIKPNKDTSFFTAITLTNFQRYYGDVYTSYPFREEFEGIEELGYNIDKKGLHKYAPKDPLELLTPLYFEELTTNENHPFIQRLRENDINAWKTRYPITVTYSERLPHTINFLNSTKYFAKYLRSSGL